MTFSEFFEKKHLYFLQMWFFSLYLWRKRKIPSQPPIVK